MISKQNTKKHMIIISTLQEVTKIIWKKAKVIMVLNFFLEVMNNKFQGQKRKKIALNTIDV